MLDITPYIQRLQVATKGEQVRDAIVNALIEIETAIKEIQASAKEDSSD